MGRDPHYVSQEDPGTAHWVEAARRVRRELDLADPQGARKLAEHLAAAQPDGATRRGVVWFVDDERDNLDLFVDCHVGHFSILTFSTTRRALRAFEDGYPCDCIVTDIFFGDWSAAAGDGVDLLGVYADIGEAKVGDLAGVWAKWRPYFALAGLDLAKHVAGICAERRQFVPVALFSRKAPLLLGPADYVVDEPTAAVSFWLPEKLSPAETDGELIGRIAEVQRLRIAKLIALRRSAAWQEALRFAAGPDGPTIALDFPA